MISLTELESYGYMMLSSLDERGIHLIRNEDWMTARRATRFSYYLGVYEGSNDREVGIKNHRAALEKAEKDIKSGAINKAYLAWKMK